jgi:hypothetical protein
VILFSEGLCQQITDACFPFLGQSDALNPIFRAQQSVTRLSNLVNYLLEFEDTGVLPNRTLTGDVFVSTNAAERTTTIPPDCNSTSCRFQCQNLFPNGKLDLSLAANGAGVIGGADVVLGDIGTGPASPTPPIINLAPANINSPPPAVENPLTGTTPPTGNPDTDGGSRILQQASWAPNIEATGLIFDVNPNPAGLNLDPGAADTDDDTDIDNTDEITNGEAQGNPPSNTIPNATPEVERPLAGSILVVSSLMILSLCFVIA